MRIIWTLPYLLIVQACVVKNCDAFVVENDDSTGTLYYWPSSSVVKVTVNGYIKPAASPLGAPTVEEQDLDVEGEDDSDEDDEELLLSERLDNTLAMSSALACSR